MYNNDVSFSIRNNVTSQQVTFTRKRQISSEIPNNVNKRDDNDKQTATR